MWKLLVEKLLKSELWVTLGAMLSSVLAKKLGVPDDAVSDLIYAMTGLAVAYIGGRSYAKPRELDASARALSLAVPPYPGGTAKP
jgi:hypothetical protein